MKTKDLVYASLLAAFISVLGLLPPLPLGFIPVPITAQTLGVMLAGSFLGRKTGAISLLLFIILVAIGLPVLSGGRGGFAALVGPSAGYILSFPIAAYAIGWATEKVWRSLKTWKMLIIHIGFGVLLVNLIGAPVMALITNTSIWAGLLGAAAYLPGDLIKAVAASLIAMQLRAVSPIEDKIHSSAS